MATNDEEESPPLPSGAVRYRLDLEYDGTAFVGWQKQAAGRSVQGALETALARLFPHPVRVVGAGRTDAGVHALGQVAHFDTLAPRPASLLLRAMNALTPPDLTLLGAAFAPEGFHARHGALYREYCYRILNRPPPPALARGRVWHVREPLDLAAMAEAGRWLRGTHDFSSFRAAACQAAHPLRTLCRVEITRREEEVWLIFGGRSFLHHMVRNLVGSLARVGRGDWTVERFLQVLRARDRRLAAATAPAEGLYLQRIIYPGEGPVPSDEDANPLGG